MRKEIRSDIAEKSRVADKPKANSKSKGLRNSIIFLLLAAATIATWQWYESSTKIKNQPQKFESQLTAADPLIENQQAEADTSTENQLAEIEKRLVKSIEMQLAEVDLSEELRTASNEIRKKREETDARFKLLETDLAEFIGKQKILEELYQDLVPNRNEATIEEVEQLLLIANQQLRLANNVKSAMVAIQEANVRLQRINHPQVSHLQNVLAKDIALLKAVPKIDIVGIGLSLDSLAETIDQLPLAMEGILSPKTNDTPHKSQTSEGTLGILQDFLLEIWADINKYVNIEQFVNIEQLVRIEHVGKQDIPPPSHSYFLRENLKLRLLAAHNSLLARDAENFQAYLETSIEWINKHFNNKSKLGISMLETLNQLHSNEITLNAPNISTSYDAVRKFRLFTKREAANALIDSKIAKKKRAEDEKNTRLLAEAEAIAEAEAKAETEAKAEAEAIAGADLEKGEEKESRLEEEVEGDSVMEKEAGEGVSIESKIEEKVGGENR